MYIHVCDNVQLDINWIKLYCITLQTTNVTRSYYSCEDIEGVYLENEGGSGTLKYCVHLLCNSAS